MPPHSAALAEQKAKHPQQQFSMHPAAVSEWQRHRHRHRATWPTDTAPNNQTYPTEHVACCCCTCRQIIFPFLSPSPFPLPTWCLLRSHHLHYLGSPALHGNTIIIIIMIMMSIELIIVFIMNVNRHLSDAFAVASKLNVGRPYPELMSLRLPFAWPQRHRSDSGLGGGWRGMVLIEKLPDGWGNGWVLIGRRQHVCSCYPHAAAVASTPN